MEPLEIHALDEGFNLVAPNIPYTSLQWNRRYYECGDFTCVVPSNVYSPDWAYIYTENRPETGIIQKVEYADTAHTEGGIDTVTLSGFFLESLLNRITFLDEQPETITETYYVPEPRNPSISKKTAPEVYHNMRDDTYVYKDRGGNAVDVATGNRVDWDSMMQPVEYNFPYSSGINATDPDTAKSNVSYYSSDGGKTVNSVTFSGREESHAVFFEDDRGDMFYFDNSGNLTMAFGVVDKKGDTYQMQHRSWLAGGGPKPRYRTVTVKSPWQRTDALEPVTEGDSVQIVYKWLQRMMGNSLIYIEPEIKGITKKVDPSFQLLGDLAFDTLKEVGASYRIGYEFEKNTLTFETWQGLDRTQEQTKNPWAVFSDTWGSIYGYDASRDVSNYRNTCYVLYEYDEPSAFDINGHPVVEPVYEWNDTGVSRTLVGYTIPYTTKRGYYTVTTGDADEIARETYLDKRDDDPKCDSEWKREQYGKDDKPTFSTNMKEIYAAYPEAIKAEAKKLLENDYCVVTNLDTGTLNTSSYMVDFDLGDKVDMAIETIGLVETARIVEVDEVYEDNKAEISLTMGESLLTDAKKATLH